MIEDTILWRLPVPVLTGNLETRQGCSCLCGTIMHVFHFSLSEFSWWLYLFLSLSLIIIFYLIQHGKLQVIVCVHDNYVHSKLQMIVFMIIMCLMFLGNSDISLGLCTVTIFQRASHSNCIVPSGYETTYACA